MKRPYQLLVENEDGEFKHFATYKTAKHAWLRGWSFNKVLDFRVLDETKEQVAFDNDGNTIDKYKLLGLSKQ